MNLLPTDEQTQILDAARKFLAGQAPVERLRPQHGQIGNHDAQLWPEFGELGFLALGLDAARGGVGLDAPEEILLYRELGRNLVSPAILGLSLGARIASRVDGAGLQDAIQSGETRVAIAVPRSPVGTGFSGRYYLLEPEGAAWVLLWSADGAGLFRTADFVDSTDALCMDSHLALERARIDAARPAIWVPVTEEDIERRARLLIAAYAVGLAEAARDMAVDYAKVREQFGKPIGTFQAIKHKCADMAIASEAAWCQTIFAAIAIREGRDDAAFHVTAAKILATDAALKNGAQNIQVHGAFGFTADCDAHLFLKRAHVMNLLGGDLRIQRANLLAC